MSPRLESLYGDQASSVLQRIDQLVNRLLVVEHPVVDSLWDERTVVLITYGDQIHDGDRSTLPVLSDFLQKYRLKQLINTIHLLPFFPFSSDDGFSVIDYNRVNPSLGDWTDIHQLGESFQLMFDFVVNHCSRQNKWFQSYLRGEQPYDKFFVDIDPDTDLSAVTRPRTSPLLTPFETKDGTRHVWTTFSADQVDLNCSSPDVLIQMLEILLNYVRHGARIIRLDAIGFLWKQIGTTCMHLPQSHEVVKLFRDLVDEVAPGTILLTETNVPHDENISYFGNGDEAHAVYQFSLAPLLLDALLTGDAVPLMQWLRTLEYPGDGMTYFNFTASHDGIGVRPLEGLLPAKRIDALVRGVERRGGRVSWRETADGQRSPYELNITYFSALGSIDGEPGSHQVRKFLTSQAIMLTLRGIPGIYFHSLVGTPNFVEGVEATGQNRTINRRKFDQQELDGILGEADSAQQAVFDGYRRLLEVRIQQPAFHPNAPQSVVETGTSSVIGFERTSLRGEQKILVLVNVADYPVQVGVSTDGDRQRGDLLTGRRAVDGYYNLDAYEIAWLE